MLHRRAAPICVRTGQCVRCRRIRFLHAGRPGTYRGRVVTRARVRAARSGCAWVCLSARPPVRPSVLAHAYTPAHAMHTLIRSRYRRYLLLLALSDSTALLRRVRATAHSFVRSRSLRSNRCRQCSSMTAAGAGGGRASGTAARAHGCGRVRDLRGATMGAPAVPRPTRWPLLQRTGHRAMHASARATVGAAAAAAAPKYA